MSDQDYTPSTEEVRENYSEEWDYYFDKPRDVSEVRRREEAFGRWLASERARIWDECMASLDAAFGTDAPWPVNPYRKDGDA